MRFLARSALFGVLALGPIACGGAPDEPEAARSEDALETVPRGTFYVRSAPASGSYIKRLTIKARKKFELEYVSVTSRSEPWVWNPWIPVPSRHEESMLVQGSYVTFADGDETIVSFDTDSGGVGNLSYAIEVDGDALRLKALGERAFVLERGDAPPPAIDKRVVSCSGRRFSAKIAFEDPERRRGTFTVKRKASAEDDDPANGSFTVVYNGNTGVDDYLGFEGQDQEGGRYEFALSRSDLNKTSGAIADVGLGYSAPMRSYYVHNTLTCTIGTR